MELSLHANATTTPRVRAYIQRSRKPVADLAIELVSETTTAGGANARPLTTARMPRKP